MTTVLPPPDFDFPPPPPWPCATSISCSLWACITCCVVISSTSFSVPTMVDTVFKVSIVCSVSVAFGAAVAMMLRSAESLSKDSLSTLVRRLLLYGMKVLGFSRISHLARMQFLRAQSELLISALSFWRALSWYKLSLRRSLPAQSMSVSTPLLSSPLSPLRSRVICRTAWDLELVPFTSVASVALRLLPTEMYLSICSVEVTSSSAAPFHCTVTTGPLSPPFLATPSSDGSTPKPAQ
mmetsp:Transcript_2964/g.5525  ORF Transcript_2964/g.5525 Transcript_2964/m.5525 type:complete len:238 (-) Transcript_2964:253-966(-)